MVSHRTARKAVLQGVCAKGMSPFSLRMALLLWVCCCLNVLLMANSAWALREMLPQKEQEVTQFGDLEIAPLRNNFV